MAVAYPRVQNPKRGTVRPRMFDEALLAGNVASTQGKGETHVHQHRSIDSHHHPADHLRVLSTKLEHAEVRAIVGATRGVAQSGSAFGWGPKGRWFKSSRPD
jgi:hypothetical protein